MSSGRTSNAVRNAAAGLMLKAVGALSQFILRTVFIRVLGTEYAGLTGVFSDLLGVLLLIELGMETAAIVALCRPVAENDARRAAALLRYYGRAFRLSGVIVMGLAALCVPFLGHIVKDVPAVSEDCRVIFLLFAGNAALSCFFADRPALLKACQLSRSATYFGIAAQCAECAASVCLLFLFRRFSVWLAVHLSVNLLKNVLLRVYVGRRYPQYFEKTGPADDRAALKKLAPDLLCLLAYNMSGVVVNSTDSIFIAALFGASRVALVGNYTLIVSGVRGCIEQAVNAVKPGVSHLAVSAPPERQLSVFRQMHFAAFYTACCSCAALYTLLGPFVGDVWFSASYVLPPSVTVLLTVNFYIAVMVYPVEAFRTANSLFRQGWWRPVATAALNLALDAALGRRFGLNGILAATVAARLLTQVWYDPYLIFRRVFRQSAWRYYLDYAAKAAFTALVCAAASLAASLCPFAGPLAGFAFRAVAAVLVPQLLLAAFWRYDRDAAALRGRGRELLRSVRGQSRRPE